MSFGNQWTFFKPRKKKNCLFSSASPHQERGTGENENFTIGATNFRNNSVQKIGEHYKSVFEVGVAKGKTVVFAFLFPL
jgi:hypothetical protein